MRTEKPWYEAQKCATVDDPLPTELRKMSPGALATFESLQKQNSAAHILIREEWARRGIVETAFWSRMSAWIGVAGAIAGSLITIIGAILLKAILPD
jgi:hypothetical protein